MLVLDLKFNFKNRIKIIHNFLKVIPEPDQVVINEEELVKEVCRPAARNTLANSR